jgi:hypothetical protein
LAPDGHASRTWRHSPGAARYIGEQARQDAIELGWDGLVLRIEDLYAATMAAANATPLPRVWAQPRRVR